MANRKNLEHQLVLHEDHQLCLQRVILHTSHGGDEDVWKTWRQSSSSGLKEGQAFLSDLDAIYLLRWMISSLVRVTSNEFLFFIIKRTFYEKIRRNSLSH